MPSRIDEQTFLTLSARELGRSSALPVIAASAARLAVPILGDCCLVDLADDRGEFVRAGEAHTDPARGHSIPGGTSRLVVPLTRRGRCIGAMTFTADDGARLHAPESRRLARQLAGLVAQAVYASLHREAPRRWRRAVVEAGSAP